MSERNVKLVVEYDGSAYSGWQLQRQCGPTVQGRLVEAVETVVNHPVELQGAGRTDRGVHALGQAANFHSTSAIPVEGFPRALNSYLPDDIAVVAAEEAPPEFNARFSALGKHYRYHVLLTPSRRVFSGRWSRPYRGSLDLEAMRAAAGHYVGLHDFAAFANRTKPPPSTTERTVFAVIVSRAGPYVIFDVLGRGFLYKMVRTMVGTLLEVGGGKRPAESILATLVARDRRQAGPCAEARGLFLMEVFYGEERLRTALEAVAGDEDVVSEPIPPWAGLRPSAPVEDPSAR